jgi:hypothetical protein
MHQAKAPPNLLPHTATAGGGSGSGSGSGGRRDGGKTGQDDLPVSDPHQFPSPAVYPQVIPHGDIREWELGGRTHGGGVVVWWCGWGVVFKKCL